MLEPISQLIDDSLTLNRDFAIGSVHLRTVAELDEVALYKILAIHPTLGVLETPAGNVFLDASGR